MISITRQVLTFMIVPAVLSTTACTALAQRTAEPFAWEGPIAAGSTVEVKGVNGPIRAVPASGSSVRVEALRSGRRSDPSEVEIVVLEHSAGLTICAVYPSGMLRRNECAPGSEGRIGASNNDVRVDFVLEIPSHAQFVARTANGPVTAENLQGSVEAFSTNGAVRIQGGSRAVARTTNGSVTIDTRGEAEARTTNGRITATVGALGSDPLRFSTTNGSITLALPAGAGAEVDMRTTNGSISTDFPISVQGEVNRRRLSGIIGSGGPRIEATTTNGSIRLERAN